MTGTTAHLADRPWARDVVGPRTKGLRLGEATTVADVLTGAPRITGGLFSWPLLTLDDATLDHNVGAVARVCSQRGVEHAPHVKTTMSRALYARQAAAGAWGATVATPSQLRTVRDWGVPRVLLANELLDPRDLAWLHDDLARTVDTGAVDDEVWLYVDSTHGVDLLARAFGDAPAAVRARLGVLVELGVPGGRTGVRSTAAALDLARAVRAGGLRLVGVAGYEGSVAGGTTDDELAAVTAWCRDLRALGTAFVREGLAGVDEPLVLSAGGSSFLDVVLAELPGPLAVPGAGSGSVPDDAAREVPVRVVVRSGAYVTHDHGFYSRTDPWSRIPGAEPLRGAATVWGQVLSVPEPGLAICGVGRRDVSFDIDLPVPLWLRQQSDDGWHPARELAGTHVTALNDQHLYLALDPATDSPATAEVRPGDVVGFGISHPCTTFDRWRVAAVVRDDEVVDLVTIDL
jgi:D-serine deaminase-like pyridoxal phosphate-dependent protein